MFLDNVRFAQQLMYLIVTQLFMLSFDKIKSGYGTINSGTTKCFSNNSGRYSMKSIIAFYQLVVDISLSNNQNHEK